MRMRHVKISDNAEQSFQLTREVVPHFYNPLHFHDKLELTYMVQGYGTAFIGDYIGQFKAGDMFFMGSRLAHDFKNAPEFFKADSTLKAEAIVLHFDEAFLGDSFFKIPEMKEVQQLFKDVRTGLKIEGESKAQVKAILEHLNQSSPVKQITDILSLLDILAHSNEVSNLSASLPSNTFNYSDAEKLDRVLCYAMDHYKEKIPLEKIAEVAHMTTSAFCRYFKLRTKRSFSEFILELRIQNASSLLLNSDYTVEQVALECGFESSSYFYRVFKKVKKETPSSYQKRMRYGKK